MSHLEPTGTPSEVAEVEVEVDFGEVTEPGISYEVAHLSYSDEVPPPSPSSSSSPPSSPPPIPSTTALPLDIGYLLKHENLSHLPQSMKLRLVNHTPEAGYNYPAKNMYGINRRFRVEWAKNHSWIHYSIADDGVYCKACALFGPSEIRRQRLGVFVTKPFQMWTKQSSASSTHEQHIYHQSAMTRMVAFKMHVLLPPKISLAGSTENTKSR